MDVYVVLNKDKKGHVAVTAVFESEAKAKDIVSKRIKNFPGIECWYVHTILV